MRSAPRDVVLVAMAAAIVVGSCGCNGGGKTQPTTAQTATVARTLAPAPTSCGGPKPSREKVTPALAPLAGHSPVWAGFYARLDTQAGTLHLVPKGTTVRTARGWRIKTLWAVAEHQQGLVKLRGRNASSGSPVLFEVGEAAVSTVGVLNPKKPGTPTPAGEPKEFPSYLYFPSAACYELTASWRGGSWKMVLGVGR